MPTCALVSFRLGLTDGVSIVASSWADALSVVRLRRHHRRRRGAGRPARPRPGHRPRRAVDRESSTARSRSVSGADTRLGGALADADLVVVENLCTIPLNLPAATGHGEGAGGAAGDPAPPRSAVAARAVRPRHRAAARRPGLAPRHHQPAHRAPSSPSGAWSPPRSTTASPTT